jgi:hypothetical protein
MVRAVIKPLRRSPVPRAVEAKLSPFSRKKIPIAVKACVASNGPFTCHFDPFFVECELTRKVSKKMENANSAIPIVKLLSILMIGMNMIPCPTSDKVPAAMRSIILNEALDILSKG